MNTERLLKLAARLGEIERTAPDRRERIFYMGSWYVPEEYVVNNCCGSAACAAGEACFMHEFQDEGLTMNPIRIPRFGRHTGFEAVKEFFGLSSTQADWLFMPQNYLSFKQGTFSSTTPGEVAARILAMVAPEVLDEGPDQAVMVDEPELAEV